MIDFNLRLIFGPPGTGKSTHLSKLVKEYATISSNMGAVSFTRTAAKVLTSKIPANSIRYIGTLHALAFKTLNMSRSDVADLKSFAEWYGTSIEVVNSSLSVYRYGFHRECSLPEAYAMINPITPFLQVEHVVESYLLWKKEYLLSDFDDMVNEAIGKVPPFDVLIIDEAQDLTNKQWEMVKQMIVPGGTVCMAGDDDQALFVWAGANPHIMVDYADLEGITTEVLEQSYRIPQAVHQVAEATVRQISRRAEKSYLPTPELGKVEVVSYYEPMMYPHKHTVLCRDQWVLAEIEDILIERGIPYSCNSGFSMWDRPKRRLAEAVDLEDYATIKKLEKYLKKEYRLSDPTNGNNGHIAACRDGWRKSVDLGTWAKERDYLAILQDPCSDTLIHLSTIHGFKGEEDDHVILMTKCTQMVEMAMDSTEAFENEVRVWYVGITRARKALTIVGNNLFIIT